MTSLQRGIPTGLTLFRLALAPVFVLAPEGWRVGLVALALLSEFLDGLLARRWEVVSKLGTLLDPIADKVFVATVIAVFVAEGRLAWPYACLVLSRDIVAVLGVVALRVVRDRGDEMRPLQPSLLGKLTTALQILLLLMLLLLEPGFPLRAATFLTSLVSLAAAWDYLFRDRARIRAGQSG